MRKRQLYLCFGLYTHYVSLVRSTQKTIFFKFPVAGSHWSLLFQNKQYLPPLPPGSVVNCPWSLAVLLEMNPRTTF
jgi:hypothetical protein